MLECRYEKVRVTQVSGEENKTIKLEGELFLPEEYGEVKKVYFSHGYLGEVRGEVNGKNLALYGRMGASLTYEGPAGEGRRPEYGFSWRGENGINFAEQIDLPDFSVGTIVEWDWDLELNSFSLQALSGRRLKYNAEISVKVKAREEKELIIVNEIESEAEVETVKERIVLEELVSVAKGSREVNHQYQVTYPKAPIARVIGGSAKPVGVRSTVSKGRITLDGFIEVNMAYVILGTEGEEALIEGITWNQQNGGALPFQIILEEPLASPEQVSLPHVWLEAFHLHAPHPELCRVQAVLGAKAELINPRPLEAVFEVSVNQGNDLDVLRQDCELEETVGEAEKILEIEKQLTLPAENLNLEKVLLLKTSRPRIGECQADQDRVFLAGEADLSLLYLGEGEENSVLTSADWDPQSMDKVAFGEFIELPGVEEGMSCAARLREEEINLEILDERSVQINIQYRVQVTVKAKRNLSLIRDCALVIEDDKPKPSMLFYLAQRGDSLWQVARRYNTTMKALAEANSLSVAEELREGLKLLIPKKTKK